MDVTIEVKRFNPEETESSSYNQNYSLDVPEHFTVLDGLIKVREEVDESFLSKDLLFTVEVLLYLFD